MSIRTKLPPALAALAAAATLAGPCLAWATPLPPVQMQGGVTYVSGGVGKEAAAAFQAAAMAWPAMLEFAAKSKPHDDFLANVKVKVLDANGHAVLDAVSDGPFLLARMVPGTYRVKATFGGKTLDRTLQVTAGQHVREVFVWPAAELNKGA